MYQALFNHLQQEGSGTFLLGKVTPLIIQSMVECGRGAIEVDATNESVIGCVLLWDAEGGWFEIGTMWTHPMHRGKGISHSLLLEILKKSVGEHILLITHNPTVVRMMLDNQFTEATRNNWSDVVPIAQSCGPCDRVVNEDKHHCPHMAETGSEGCRMFFRTTSEDEDSGD